MTRRRYKEYPPIPIDWLSKTIMRYIIDRTTSSEETTIVFRLISDWKKENDENEKI